MCYKDEEDEIDFFDYRKREAEIDNINKSDSSFCEEEDFEDLIFPPSAIISLIDNVNPDETNEMKVNKLKYLNDTIGKCQESDFDELIDGEIHRFLIISFTTSVDQKIFQYTVKCIETWVLNTHSPKISFAEIDFMNAVLFAATSYSKETFQDFQYTTFSLINPEQRLSLIKIFREVISRNEGMHEQYPRQAFFSRCTNAFVHERSLHQQSPKMMEAILSLIEFFFKRNFESPLILSEVMSLEDVIMPLVQEDVTKIDSLYLTMLNIAERFFCYSEEFALFFLENIDMTEVLHNSINADNHKKCYLIQIICSCANSDTGPFFESFLNTWKWSYFVDFLEHSDPEVFKHSLGDFLHNFIEQYPIILNGGEFEDFITFLIENFDKRENDIKVPIITILTFCMRFDNMRLNFHLLEEGIIQKCSLFLDANDDVALNILKSIDHLCGYFIKDPSNYSNLMEEMSENQMIEAIADLEDSENEEISQLSSYITKTYISTYNPETNS